MSSKIPVDKEVSIEVEEIKSPTLKAENTNPFINYQIAKAYYARNGFTVLEGHDFEYNMLAYLSPEEVRERALLDDYTRIKLWKAKRNEQAEEYAGRIIETIGLEKAEQLLHICRLCSFLGGPGFPDLILIKDREFLLKQVVSEEFLLEQKMFYLLAGVALELCNIKLVDVKPQNSDAKAETISFVVKELLGSVINSKRFYHYWIDLAGLIKGERDLINGLGHKEKTIAMHADEIAYLEEQQHNMPFLMFKSWLERGFISKEDVENNMRTLAELNRKRKEQFTKYHKMLQSDGVFRSLLPYQDNESMKKKKEYIQERFSLGESRSIELLKFVSSV